MPLSSLRSANSRRRSLLTRFPVAVTALAVTASAGLVVPALAGPADAAAAAPAVADYTSYVDPFMSTEGDDGQNLPGAQVPHGLAKPNPMTYPGRSHTGYDYSQSRIKGFTMSNLDGVGGSGAGGDLLVVPTYQRYTSRPDTTTYALPFSHDEETAEPGYYQVGLQSDQGTIDSELTATVRSGLAKFTFPATGTASLVLDLANNFTGRLSSDLAVTTLDDGRAELSGTVVGTFNGNDYRLHFDTVTSVAVSGVKTWGGGGGLTSTRHRSGTDTGAVLSFDVTAGDAVQLTTTLSPISVDQARTDRAAELDTMSFDDVRAAAHEDWQDTLARVAVGSDATADPDGSLEGIFYTSLYRMLATPVDATSTDGTYAGVDGKVHHADGYTHYDGWGTWDDFRKYSVLAYLYPDVYADVVQSLVDLFADDAAVGSPSLSSVTHAVPTVRFERAAIVIADAVSKGVHLDDLAQAYPAIISNADTYNAANQALGYLAGDPGTTVATSYDDYALSVIATSLGRTADAAAHLARSTNYRNVIKPAAWTAGDGSPVGVLSSRTAAGTWGSDDLAQFQAANLYQGTLWQFNWYPAQDMAGLIETMGGTAATRAALSNYFGEQAPDDGTKMLKSNANEVDLQTPYLFNYLGQPSKTQKWVRDLFTKETWQNYIATGQTNNNVPPSSNGRLTPPIKEKVFELAPDGFLPTMDDDTGAMSATFVAAAVGLYPVTAGSSQYQVGSPFFPSVDISHADGTSFRVTAEGVSPDRYYVQSATLDGAPYDNTWVDYSDLVGDGSFDTTMGATASDWGATSQPAFSMSTADPATPAAGTVTSDPTTAQADVDGNVDGHLTMTLAGGAFAGTNGDEFADLGLVDVTGLPDGVDATVTRTSTSTLDVHVTGTLAVLAKTRFAVRLHDGALADGLTADDVTGTGLTMRDPFAIVVAAHWRAVLKADFAESRLIIQANYSGATYRELVTARDHARTVLADEVASDSALAGADSDLTSAMDAMTLSQGGYRRLEAEQSDSWSGGADLHNETSNLGGVRPGSWIAFDGVSFSDSDLPDQISIRYSGASADGYPNAAVEVHVGSVDGPVVATVATPPTASTFGTYATMTADLSNVPALTGDTPRTIYFVFTGSDTTGVPHWVGNFDWMQFTGSTAPSNTDVSLTGDNRTDWRTDTSAGGGALKTETGTWQDGVYSVIANTHDGDWVHWEGVDLTEPKSRFSVHYVNNSARVGADVSVDVFLDSMTGSPVTNVPLPVTGADWNTSGTVTVTLPAPISGTHDVYVVLHDTPDSSHPYAGNFASFTFSAPVDTSDGVPLAAAEYDDWSGGTLKTETSSWDDGTTVTDVGGTTDGAWLEFDDVAFAQTATSLSVHYVNNSSRCGTGSRIDVYLDSMTGDPVTGQPLPVTGTGWSNAGTTTMTLPTAISGTHTVFVVMHTTPDANHPYVANFDSFTFNYGVDKTGLQRVHDTYLPLLDDAARYVDVDVRTLTRALTDAEDVLHDDTALASDVAHATKTLQLAGGQMDPRAERLLLAAISDADAVQPLAYTEESVAALAAEVATARAMLDADTSSDDELSAQADSVQAAITALVPRAASAPLPPTAVSAVASGRSLTITWAAPEYDGGSAITGYHLELDGPSGSSADVDGATTSYTFTGLERGYDYRARVVATNGIGSSEPSSYTAYVPIAQTVPTAPAQPAVTVSGTEVRVAWTAPDDGGSDLTGYLVTLGTGVGTAVQVSATATDHTFTDVAPGTYTATVAALNALGRSDYSPASHSVAVTVSPTVSRVSATATSPTKVEVGWTLTGTTDPVVLEATLTYHGADVVTKQVWSAEGSVTFRDLLPATRYGVSVAVLHGADGPTRASVRTKAAPRVSAHPVQVHGKATVHHRLAVALHKKAWSAGTRFTYTWIVGGTKVGHAARLKITRPMVGKRVKVRVTGHRPGWTSATVTSKAVRIRR